MSRTKDANWDRLMDEQLNETPTPPNQFSFPPEDKVEPIQKGAPRPNDCGTEIQNGIDRKRF